MNFWATWCAPCIIEFPELQKTYRMYRSRNLEFVTVSTDGPEAKAAVIRLLQEQRASGRNLLFGVRRHGGACRKRSIAPAGRRAFHAAARAGRRRACISSSGKPNSRRCDGPYWRTYPTTPSIPDLRAYWAGH